jgi:hypothetical protein
VYFTKVHELVLSKVSVNCSVLHEELLQMQETYNLQLVYCSTASTAVYIEINLLLQQEVLQDLRQVIKLALYEEVPGDHGSEFTEEAAASLSSLAELRQMKY